MSSLILFSGGVESTALLSMARPNDTLLCIEPVYPGDLHTFRRATAEQIAKHFGFEVRYASADIPMLGPFVHQMRVFISICNLWVAKDASIRQVLCGRNSSEPSPDIAPFIKQMMFAWGVLHPDVEFLHPLDHLTKKEQLALIPAEVRPIVSSCIYHTNCGECVKCRELR